MACLAEGATKLGRTASRSNGRAVSLEQAARQDRLMTNPFGLFEPDQRFRAALTTIDLGQAELVVTPHKEAADWARDHGYRIDEADHQGLGAIYEIRPGEQAPSSPDAAH